MNKRKWKRVLGLALAFAMAVTAIPVTAWARVETEKLVNIAGACEITVPSQEGKNPVDNMVDGNPSTMWVNNGANWPSQVEFKLPTGNTKSVKKVVLKFEQVAGRSMDVSLKYALNNVTEDLIAVEGSAKTAMLNEGYEYVFETPQAMSHLYVILDRPLTNGAAGAFWPAIAEAELYVDQDAEEVVELENLAKTRASAVVLEDSVNQAAGKANVTDGDFQTSAALHTRKFSELGNDSVLPFAEVRLGVNQKIRKFVVAMKEDASGAEYQYRILGKVKNGSSYIETASGSVGTSASGCRVEISVEDLGLDRKEVEYETLRVEFSAKNAAARDTIPQLAEFQILANKATIAESDGTNIVWGSTSLHSNYNEATLGRIVDGNTKNTWTATQYPAYVDIDLEGEYDLSKIEVFMPQAGYSQYSLYASKDGQNYTKLAEKTSTDSCPAAGEAYPVDITASSVRILLEYHSQNAQAVLNEIRVMGTRVGDAKKAEFVPPIPYKGSPYDVQITQADTVAEVQGIVERNLGEEYKDWFEFVVGREQEYDYYEIEDAQGKIRITGNDGVSLASGLNYYLKYFCKVSIAQVGSQTKMPGQIVRVEEKIHRECKVPVRYAYNYCTMSYSMPFWGEEEWRKELDWLALNGVNAVLDVTAQEEVWRQFLGELGYSHEEAKDYIAGPAYYAWAYMANLSGFGGPVHDSWFVRRTELARKNQLAMRKLGMQPILQGYSGMVPVNVAQKATGAYALGAGDVIAQGAWCSFQRPYMLKTTSAAYEKYAELFYQCQENVFGEVTNLYATDPFHEGGNTGPMNPTDVSSHVLDSLLKYDADAVWVIQAWQGNPSAELINGLEGRKEHALILDLYAEKTPHWNDNKYSGGREFQNTPWVYCMLNNFGGRMGLHGHMDNLVNGVVQAANTSQKMTGIGITPEASQNNPVLYDLLFETVWCEDAAQPLEKINTETWLRDYATRRYGAESEYAYQAMRILENTVYKASLNGLGQGSPESYVNARPAASISAASTWGNAVISYDMAELEEAARLLLRDYDKLKGSDGYLYDVADILKQILSNSSQKAHAKMIEAINARDLDAFTEASDAFLALIDKVEEVLGTRKEFLLGTWVEQAKALAKDTDDFTMDLYEFNAKALITTWGGYPQCESGGLKDYSNRQWAGLTKDFYKQRWSMWIAYQKEVLSGRSPAAVNWFAFEWAWARANDVYTTEASGKDLAKLGKDILKHFSSAGPESDASLDYPVDKISLHEVGSEETTQEQDGAANVLDGNKATFWHTNWSGNTDNKSYEKHYLIFALEEETELTGLRYLPRQDAQSNGVITGYQISVSSDGAAYQTVAEGSWAADKAWKLASFQSPVTAKYVKLQTTSAQGGYFSSAAEIRLTVPPVLAESVEIQAEKSEIQAGDTLQLTAVVLPENTSNPEVEWTSEDTQIADVDEYGVVTAKAEGTAVIKAETTDGSAKTAKITLKIKKSEEQIQEELREKKKKEQRAALQAMVNNEAGKKASDYTESTWNTYAAALKEAKRIIASADATLEQIEAAKEMLIRAEKALERKQAGPVLPQVGYRHETKTLVYQVTASTETAKTVSVVKAKNKKAKKLTIPATVKIQGYTYQVTEIAPKAFQKSAKLTQVKVGKKIKKIGKQAFLNCKKLKKVTILSSVIKQIGSQAWKGMDKKAKIFVPKKKYKAYVKMLKKAKMPKSVKIVKK